MGRGGAGIKVPRAAVEQTRSRRRCGGGPWTWFRARHADFGPTFAREKLVEVHGLSLSAETLRKWMVEDGLRRVPPPSVPRGPGPDRRLGAHLV